ncbi:MAG TPA: glycosyltransferase family 2 protein [Vicinamibacterales bacterium]|nr:glycosyltransferase family 2 protein [Vicinamibacterales bacterium]
MLKNEPGPSGRGPAAVAPAIELGTAALGRAEAAPAVPLEVAVIVPTFNERDNVTELIARVERALRDISWEMIFVDDDSPDGTSDEVKRIGASDNRIRCITRIGRRGLSSACIEGMLASAAPVFVVMDGDLQHDESRIPAMLNALRAEGVQLVIASRYTAGGAIGEWDRTRAFLSRIATRLSRVVCRQPISDPMSGFFMITAEALDGCVRRLSGKGFKILLDIVASSPAVLRVAEVPYTFRERLHGESKVDSLVMWDFGMLLAEKTIGRYIPVRFFAFTLVGGGGVLVHMAVLAALRNAQVGFSNAQAVATVVAMIFNFWLNNLLTYRDRRLRGTRWVTGLLSFMAACGLGAVANVGIASYLFASHTQWVVAALAGIAVGAVWNYAITQLYTWGQPRSRRVPT